MTLDLSNIQGNILPGFSKDHQAFVLVGFPDGQSGRTWLTGIQSEIASAAEVMAFKELFKAIRERRIAQGWLSPTTDDEEQARDTGALRTVSACWVNVGLSFLGLQLLTGPANVARFPPAFRSNAAGTAPWVGPRDVHALLIVGADWADDLKAELQRQRQRFAASHVVELATFRGDSLTGELRGREQFGFKDGISQPRVAGTEYGKGPSVAAGEFILGHADQEGQVNNEDLPRWSKDGSYLVFLQMQQHVQAFRAEMQQAAQQLGLSADVVKAGVVGRMPDGTLVDPPSRLSHTSRGFPQWLPP